MPQNRQFLALQALAPGESLSTHPEISTQQISQGTMSARLPQQVSQQTLVLQVVLPLQLLSIHPEISIPQILVLIMSQRLHRLELRQL